MDEIKRALLGDREAQRAVTERGELLPCPKCYSKDIFINNLYFEQYLFIECKKCEYESGLFDKKKYKTKEQAEKELIEDWNTRPQLLTAEELGRLEGEK